MSVVPPLNSRNPIVNADGTPSFQFMRFWQELFGGVDATGASIASILASITSLSNDKADKATNINAGTGLAGGGDLSADRTLALANTAVTPGSYTNTNLTVDAQGRITAAANGSGGGSGATPTVRGSTITAFNASSVVAPFPVGTVAGDLVMVLTGHGFATTLPSGWTDVTGGNLTGTNWNGRTFIRAITTAEATTGSVTVTFGGSFNGVVAVIAFAGNRLLFRSSVFLRAGAGVTSIGASSDGTPATTDYVVYFGSNRAASNNTVTLGTQLQQVNATNGSGVLNGGIPASNGGVSPTYNFSVAGTGYYTALVTVTAY